jgi:hypothetical protein
MPEGEGRASFRRGEVRLVLGMPEPWSESDRAAFLSAIEGISVGVDGALFAPGNVHVQAAFLVTWNGSDPKPGAQIDSTQIEKLVIKYGLTEPALRRAEYQKGFVEGDRQGHYEGYQKGKADCEATHDGIRSAYHHSGYNAGLVDAHDPSLDAGIRPPLPTFDLSPLPELEHTCLNCLQTLQDCDRQGCGGAKEPGFRFGPRDPQETTQRVLRPAVRPDPLLPDHVKQNFATNVPADTAAEAFTAAVLPDALLYDPTANPHGPGSPESNGSMRAAWDLAYGDSEDCEDNDCLLRHDLATDHIRTQGELEGAQSAGIVCNEEDCSDFHYLNDGSEHAAREANEERQK